MSIVDEKMIDGLAQVEKTGDLVVLIVDHLSWIVPHHFMLLEKKINTALAFVQSGEIFKKYPDAKQKFEDKQINIIFQIVLKYPPTQKADENFKLIYNLLQSVGIKLECIVKNDYFTQQQSSQEDIK